MKTSKIRRALHDPVYVLLGLMIHGWFSWMPDRLYLRLRYRVEMGEHLHLNNPTTFSEKLQWLKLYDRDPRYTAMVDKLRVKDYVARKLGQEYVIPTLGHWERAEDIDFDALPEQFVLKCNHDSGSIIICRDKSTLDREAARKKLDRRLRRSGAQYGREWPYRNVQRCILAEPYLEDTEHGELLNYQYYCFGGEPAFCQLSQNRMTQEEIDYYDRNWELQPFKREEYPRGLPVSRPERLERMLVLAEKLAEGTEFARVDFYNVGKRIFFGEITLYPGGGFCSFDPPEWNAILGSYVTLPEKRRAVSRKGM